MRLGSSCSCSPPCAGSVRAQRPRRPACRSDTLATVTVTAARVARRPHRRAGPHGRRRAARRMADAAVRSVAEALDARTPAVVRRYGAGGLASVSVRGAGAAQTLVLLDGQPLTDPQLGQLDLSLLPSALLESVEVTGGAASGLFGSGALGGVVGLRTRRRAGRARRGRGGRVGRAPPERARGRAPRRVSRPSSPREAWQTAGRLRRARPDADRVAARAARRAGTGGRPASSRRSAREGADGAAPASASGSPTPSAAWAARPSRRRGRGRPARSSARGSGTACAASRRRPRGRCAWGTSARRLAATRTRLRYASPFPATPRRRARRDRPHADARARRARRRPPLRARAGPATALVAAASRAVPSTRASPAARATAPRALASRRVGRVGRATPLPRPARRPLRARARPRARSALSPQLGVTVALSPAAAAARERGPRLPDADAQRPLLDARRQPRTCAPSPASRPTRASRAGARRAHAEVTAYAARTRDLIVWSARRGRRVEPRKRRPRPHARRRGDGRRGAPASARSLLDGGAAAACSTPATPTPASACATRRGGRPGCGPAPPAAPSAPTSASAPSAPARRRPRARSRCRPRSSSAAQVRWTRRVGAGVLGVGLALDNLADARYESVRSYPMPPRNARLRLTLDLP